MTRILSIAGGFAVYRPCMSGRPVYRWFPTIEEAVAFRATV